MTGFEDEDEDDDENEARARPRGWELLLVHIRNLGLNQLRKQNQRFLLTEVTGLTWNRRRHSFLGYA